MKYILFLLSLLVTFVSCESDDALASYNEDPKNPVSVEADVLFSSATKSLFDQMVSTDVNLNITKLISRYWTQTTYLDESNYNLTQRNIPEGHWSEMYRDVLYDLKDAKGKVSGNVALSDADKKARIAQITVLEVYTWQQLVDTFGDIPYTEALDSEKYPTPKYDSAVDVYTAIITNLNAVITDFGAGSGFSSSDFIYAGTLSSWAKFANSLKLRIAMRLADVDPSQSKTLAEAAVKAGVFTSNSDNARFRYASSTPNTNPLWVDLVQSGRSDYVIADVLVNTMNDLNDPRRSYYFDDNLAGGYVGGVYSKSNNYASYTHIGEKLKEPTFEGLILDYVEVKFLLAEAVERGYAVGSTAEQHYNDAIESSILYWGGSGGDVDAYLATPKVSYTTAEGDWKKKIGKQFWLGMYNRGFEGWCVYRKYDFQIFPKTSSSKEDVPNRYTYPVNEQNLNNTNRESAATNIGGDEKSTKLFWDKN